MSFFLGGKGGGGAGAFGRFFFKVMVAVSICFSSWGEEVKVEGRLGGELVEDFGGESRVKETGEAKARGGESKARGGEENGDFEGGETFGGEDVFGGVGGFGGEDDVFGGDEDPVGFDRVIVGAADDKSFAGFKVGAAGDNKLMLIYHFFH